MLFVGGSCCGGQVRFPQTTAFAPLVGVEPLRLSVRSSARVLEEAKKLVGAGNKHLVLGDVVSAVAVFQDACGML